MLKGKEGKKWIRSEILFLFILLIFAFIISNFFYLNYKKDFYQEMNYVVGNITEKHPELESDLIDAILSGEENQGEEILKKYGIVDIDDLDYFSYITKKRNHFYLFFFSFTIGIFSIISFFYYRFFRKNQKKIREINQYMIDVLNGKDTFDVKDYEEGEISSLKNDIYKITVQLKEQKEKAVEGKKELETVLSDISHQIKTPLTSMYVINDLLYNNELTEEERKEFLGKNKTQLERIEWLVSSLLKISRLDSGMIELKKEKVTVHKLIKEALELIQIPIELKEQKVSITCDPLIQIETDGHWTKEAMINILKNAHEHSKEKQTIEITVEDNRLYTMIKITDHGEGIDKKEQKLIFKRFYKGNSNKESIGIGLNMAFVILKKQGADISVESEKGKGTTFFLKFYRTDI